MSLFMRYLLFPFVIITILKEGESQMGKDMTFLEQVVVNYLFPKDLGVVRVRRMNEAKRIEGIKVLDFIGMVKQYGYPAEEHDVTTEDGYNLKVHRIPTSPLWRNTKKKNVVFIQHGILCSSECWVMFGPNKDLAFLLADEGYDVWIGNIRGNSYGRSHVNMTIHDRQFWQFSFHETAVLDLPVIFDYVLNHTGQENMHYVGHSMGTTMLFVLLSMKPEYNAKIKLGICLAPAAFWKEVEPMLRQFAYMTPVIKGLLARYNVYDFGAQSAGIITLGRILCPDGTITQSICIAIYFLIAGADPPLLNTTTLPYLVSHFPAGASVQTFYHFYQNMLVDNFQTVDYGPVGNYQHYKQKTPITYDLRKVTAPIVLFYSSNDAVIKKANVLELIKHLPNVISEEVAYKLFNHADFIWGIGAKTLLYDRVIEIMLKFDTE